MYDDDTDFRQVMEQLVSRRRKLCPIKLEYTRLMDESVLDTLCAYLDLKKKHIFHSEAPLDLSFFSRIRDLMRSKKELFMTSIHADPGRYRYVRKYHETGGAERPLPVFSV